MKLMRREPIFQPASTLRFQRDADVCHPSRMSIFRAFLVFARCRDAYVWNVQRLRLSTETLTAHGEAVNFLTRNDVGGTPRHPDTTFGVD